MAKKTYTINTPIKGHKGPTIELDADDKETAELLACKAISAPVESDDGEKKPKTK